MSDGQNHSISDLKNGNVIGIDANTHVAIWTGVTVSNGGSARLLLIQFKDYNLLFIFSRMCNLPCKD